jgi:hypothetical protein
MGLFGDAYDQNTYAPGADQRGMLERILANYNAAPPQNVDASPTMNANAAAPAPQPQPTQASPIAIGNDYQMPRIGPAAAFELPPGQLDPDTGNHVVQPAAAPAAAPQPQNAWSNFFNKAADGLDSVAHGGTILGALRGQPTDAHSVQLRQLQAQHDAFVGAGFTPQEAQLAVLGGPEVAKTLIARKFGPPQTAPEYGWDPQTRKAVHLYTPEQKDNFQVVQTGENGMGGKSFSKMNKADGTMTPIAGAPGADANGGIGDITPQELATATAMTEGRQAPPSGLALTTKPYWQRMMTVANHIDPSFDQTNWSGRVAGVKDFASGKSSEMVRSANQTLQHVNALLDSADALHNGSYPLVNWAGNKLNEATGGGEPGAFKTNAHAVADEMSKVFKGGNLSDSEIRAWEENLSPNMSPAQQRAQIGKLSELLHGSLQALEEKRVGSIGQVAADKAGPIIKPAGQAVLKRIDAWLKAGGGAGALPAGWSVKVN